MRIRILRSARQDLIDGYWFYEELCGRLGEHFSESIGQDIESLLVYAGIHPMVYGKHRMVASRFPHSIFYLVEGDQIRVYAVIDNRRDPEWISERMN